MSAAVYVYREQTYHEHLEYQVTLTPSKTHPIVRVAKVAFRACACVVSHQVGAKCIAATCTRLLTLINVCNISEKNITFH